MNVDVGDADRAERLSAEVMESVNSFPREVRSETIFKINPEVSAGIEQVVKVPVWEAGPSVNAETPTPEGPASDGARNYHRASADLRLVRLKLFWAGVHIHADTIYAGWDVKVDDKKNRTFDRAGIADVELKRKLLSFPQYFYRKRLQYAPEVFNEVVLARGGSPAKTKRSHLHQNIISERKVVFCRHKNRTTGCRR